MIRNTDKASTKCPTDVPIINPKTMINGNKQINSITPSQYFIVFMMVSLSEFWQHSKVTPQDGMRFDCIHWLQHCFQHCLDSLQGPYQTED